MYIYTHIYINVCLFLFYFHQIRDLLIHNICTCTFITYYYCCYYFHLKSHTHLCHDRDLDQTENEIMCVHRMCGCYKTDLNDGEMFGESNYDGNDNNQQQQQQGDFFGCLNRSFAALCCGRLFKCHWQICGICAVAQEGRQMDSLVPIDRRRIDYVTFQSYFDYMNDIRKLRAEENGSLWAHFMALSKLSRMMIKTLLYVIIVLFMISISVRSKGFQWTNLLVVSFLIFTLCNYLLTKL